MKEKSVIRFAKMQISRRAALLRAFHVNESGDRTWVATSSPMHKLAATEICRVFERPNTIVPPAISLQEVLQVPGRTAWCSAAGPDVHAAAQQACLQDDIRTALGLLIMVTLSTDCSIVQNMKIVLNAACREAPSAMKQALVVGFDEAASVRARIDVLAVGCGVQA